MFSTSMRAMWGRVCAVAAVVCIGGALLAGCSSESDLSKWARTCGGPNEFHPTLGPSETTRHVQAAGGHDMSKMEPAAVPPKALSTTKDGWVDASKVDLSGVAGVSADEQARAEDLVRKTVTSLKKYEKVRTAKLEGFYSLDDFVPMLRCHEHWVSEKNLTDDRILDPEFPESLVYRIDSKHVRHLEAAMFELPYGSTFKDVPNVGGKLTQWHEHGGMCYRPKTLLGTVENSDGSCPVGYEHPDRRKQVPMLHVWVIPKPCGPFSSLDDGLAGENQLGNLTPCKGAHAH